MNKRIVKSFLLVGFLFAADKLIALLRQIMVGQHFGVGLELDAFNAANNLPDMLFALISGGAMAVAIIPVLTEAIDRDGREAAWALFSRLANWAFLITAAMAVLLAVFAEPFISHVVVPNLDPEHQALTTRLMRLDLLALLIFSISGLVMGSLQAYKHFLLPGLAPILYNCGLIFGVLVLVPQYGIFGLAYGTIIGAALHLAIQIPALIRFGFRWTPSLDWRSPGVLKAATLMGPRILTVAAIQTIFVATDNFASGLGAGAITALAYGWLILQVPETVLGSALGTVLLPTLSELADRGNLDELRRMIRRAALATLGMTLPVLTSRDSADGDRRADGVRRARVYGGRFGDGGRRGPDLPARAAGPRADRDRRAFVLRPSGCAHAAVDGLSHRGIVHRAVFYSHPHGRIPRRGDRQHLRVFLRSGAAAGPS